MRAEDKGEPNKDKDDRHEREKEKGEVESRLKKRGWGMTKDRGWRNIKLKIKTLNTKSGLTLRGKRMGLLSTFQEVDEGVMYVHEEENFQKET